MCPSADCNWRGCEVPTSCKEQCFWSSKRRIAFPYGDLFPQVHLMESVNKCWRPCPGIFLLVKHTPTLALPRLLDLFQGCEDHFLNERPCVPVSGASVLQIQVTNNIMKHHHPLPL